MQRIKSLPRRCYSSCRGGLIRLKTRKYSEQGVGAVFFTLICVLILREWNSGAPSVAYSCSCDSVCNVVEEHLSDSANSSSHVLCKRVCRIKSAENMEFELSLVQQPPSPFARMVLCIFAIIFVLGHNIRNSMKKPICLASPQDITWQTVMFRQLPLKTVTKVIGKLAACQFPYPLNQIAIRGFARLVGINIKEAENADFNHYKSVLQLFTRKLRQGIRPVNSNYEIVSPTDSTVIHVGVVVNDTIEQIKGVHYSLKTFAGRGVLPECKEGHSLFNAVFYLSPAEYHHFHSPTKWKATLCRHFKGDLLTVTPWAVKHVPGLFALNERVWLSGQWEHGFFSMTAVGALNVGSIHVKVCKELSTKDRSQNFRYTPYTDRRLSPTCLSKGEYLGGFDMGSTIVLVFEAPNDFRFAVGPGDVVKYGQALGSSVL